MPGDPAAHVAILLSTYDGARYLPEQLTSFCGQTHDDWTLHWRDDGSRDKTVGVLRRFSARHGRTLEHADAFGNIGVLASYMGLLREVAPTLHSADAIAFADQDDVWLPEKISRGVIGLREASGPALYCARYLRVDRELRTLGESARLSGPTAFPAALTQNVATGCTILLNRAAAQLVAQSAPPPGTLHDWWCYLVVTAAGGALLRDEMPVLKYRQHADNAVGAPPSLAARAAGAWRRGPRQFMALLRAHVAALLCRPALLCPPARRALIDLDAALAAPGTGRVKLLSMPNLARQTWLETLVFRAWLLFG